MTYKIILKSQPSRIFTVSYELSNELALTQPGDEVSIRYIDSENGICTATGFDNLEFEQRSAGGSGSPDSNLDGNETANGLKRLTGRFLHASVCSTAQT